MKRAFFIAAVLILSGILFTSCAGRGTDSAAESKPPSPIAVRVVTPLVRDMEIGVSYIGTVSSRKEVKVIARVPGTVVELPLREGENAAAGDLLARVDAPEIRAQVERLTVDRDYWARRSEADKRLVEKKALAPEQADAGERTLKITEAALAEAASQLDKTRERAPFGGTILTLYVEPGQSILPGQPILLFGSGEAELRAEVAEEDLRRGVGRGVTADIEIEPGRLFRTRAAEVSPAAGGLSRTFTVRIPLPDRPGLAPRVGSSLRVNFILQSREKSLTLPSGAVAAKTTDPHIFLVRDGRAFRQPVKTGIESRGRVVVDFPWNGLDKAAVSNIAGLSDGAAVFAVDAEEAAE